jgi:hypothetical protein
MSEAMEYRDSMQQAARTFLERHQAEHLGDDARLFERAARYLVQAMEVPVFMAQRLVHLAMSDLGEPKQPWIGIDLASGPDYCSVMLIDHRTGERALLPRRILPSRFIARHPL